MLSICSNYIIEMARDGVTAGMVIIKGIINQLLDRVILEGIQIVVRLAAGPGLQHRPHSKVIQIITMQRWRLQFLAEEHQGQKSCLCYGSPTHPSCWFLDFVDGATSLGNVLHPPAKIQ